MLQNLVAEMARSGIKNKDIAESLSLNEKTVFNKIHGASTFTINESIGIRDTFFPDKDLEYLFKKAE